MIKRYLDRLPHAFRGFFYALGHDFGFRTQFYIAGFIAIIIIYFLNPLTISQFLFLGVAAMFILITEMQNSAFESALDHLHPERHESIKQSKDMAAASVLMAALFALLVLVLITIERLIL